VTNKAYNYLLIILTASC